MGDNHNDHCLHHLFSESKYSMMSATFRSKMDRHSRLAGDRQGTEDMQGGALHERCDAHRLKIKRQKTVTRSKPPVFRIRIR